MQHKKITGLVMLLLSSIFTVSAQSEESFFIEQINVDIAVKSFFGGNTKPKNLKHYLDLKDGQVFKTLSDLDTFIAKKDKDIKDLRIFKAGGSVTYQLSGTQLDDGSLGIIVDIKAEEAFNMFVVPGAKYDSNNGFKMALKFWHFNAFGSMRLFYATTDYEIDENGHQSFGVGLAATIPIFIKEKQWNIDVGTGLKYAGSSLDPTDKSDMESSIFNMRVGISTSWQLGQSRHKIYTGFVESVNLTAGQFYGVKDEDAYYFSSKIYADLPMELVDIPWMGTLNYNVSVGGSTHYRFDKKVQDKRTGFFPYLSTGFSISNIEREDNFYRGLALYTGIHNSFDPSKARNYGITGDHRNDLDQYAWNISLYGGVRGSLPINKNFQIKGRFGWDYAVFGDQDDRDLAKPIRGIRNNRMQGDMLLYWNTDFVMNVWLWRLAALGEVHASIFYDGGLSRDFRGKWNEPFNAIGIELIVYPSFSRSVQIRMSFGEDLYALYMNKDIRGTSPRDGRPQHELYFGLSLHY